MYLFRCSKLVQARNDMNISINQFLSQIHPIEEELLTEFTSLWKDCEVPKKTIMTGEGEIESGFYYVVEGIQKAYFMHEGRAHVVAFTYSPSFSGIPGSFVQQRPSKYYLETITASKFKRISYENYQRMLNMHRPIETLFRKAMEHFLVGMIDRHAELMAYDIETRFRTFTKRSPHLIQMVSQKDLASYLRIDPTNFSKLITSVRI